MKVYFALILILIYVDATGKGSVKITLAGKTGGSISKEEFINANKLEVISSDNDSTLKVESLIIAIAGRGTQYKEFKIKGNLITNEVDSTISKLQAGNKIFIDPVIVTHHKTLRGIRGIELVLTD